MSGCEATSPGASSGSGWRSFFYNFPADCTSPRLDEQSLYGDKAGNVHHLLPQPEQVGRSSSREGSFGNAALAVIFKGIAADPLGQKAIMAAIRPSEWGDANITFPLRTPGQPPAEKSFSVNVAPAYLDRVEKKGGLVQRREDVQMLDGNKIVHCDHAITATWPGALETALAVHLANGDPLEEGYARLTQLCSTREGVIGVMKMVLGEDSVLDIDLTEVSQDPSSKPGARLAQVANLGSRGIALVWLNQALAQPGQPGAQEHLYDITGPGAQGVDLSDAEGNHYPSRSLEEHMGDPHALVVTWGGNHVSSVGR